MELVTLERHLLSGVPEEEARLYLESLTEFDPKRSVKSGLAEVMRVLSIRPIRFTNDAGQEEEAANIVAAEVGYEKTGGMIRWGAVVMRDSFKVGDLCVVFKPDAVVATSSPALAFMNTNGSEGIIRLRRLKGAPSEVLVMPVEDVLPDFLGNIVPGLDVTYWTGTLKYEKPLPSDIGGDFAGNFDPMIPKTDEPRFQTVPNVVSGMVGRRIYGTVKMDGTSQTARWYDGDFRCYGRNYELKDTPKSAVWQIAHRYGLPEKLAELGRNIAIQFECVGPGIAKNRLALKQIEPRVFTIFEMDTRRRLPAVEMFDLCAELGLPTAPIAEVTLPWGETVRLWDVEFRPEWNDPEVLRVMADGFYHTTQRREGIVIRTMDNSQIDGLDASFKSVSLLYKDS